MAAGLGFKDFTTGEVLTAADVDGYLMQGVWVFASAAARDAAVTSPQEGNFAYLKDTNVTTYYTGSAWANLDTTGMTNPMTTTGDTIYSSSGSTPARLGIGSTGDVLTVAGGVPSWAAPAGGGGLTLLSTTSLTGASVTISSISGAYKNLRLFIKMAYATAADDIQIRFNGDTGNNYNYSRVRNISTTLAGGNGTNGSFIYITGAMTTNNTDIEKAFVIASIPRYTDTDIQEVASTSYSLPSSGATYFACNGVYNKSAAITSITLLMGSGNFSGGTAYLYGEN